MANSTEDREAERRALARDVARVALLRGDFVLSSGARSSYYVDKYLFETDPGVLRRIASWLAPLVPAGTQRIAGTELGAVALATALALETNLPFVIVRRDVKGYGTAKAIEGTLQAGDTVTVIEDVVTSGAQCIKAADRVKDAGGSVIGILAVLDRNEGGADRIGAAGYAFTALFQRLDLED